MVRVEATHSLHPAQMQDDQFYVSGKKLFPSPKPIPFFSTAISEILICLRDVFTGKSFGQCPVCSLLMSNNQDRCGLELRCLTTGPYSWRQGHKDTSEMASVGGGKAWVDKNDFSKENMNCLFVRSTALGQFTKPWQHCLWIHALFSFEGPISQTAWTIRLAHNEQGFRVVNSTAIYIWLPCLTLRLCFKVALYESPLYSQANCKLRNNNKKDRFPILLS